jgi:hypothetical protein
LLLGCDTAYFGVSLAVLASDVGKNLQITRRDVLKKVGFSHYSDNLEFRKKGYMARECSVHKNMDTKF